MPALLSSWRNARRAAASAVIGAVAFAACGDTGAGELLGPGAANLNHDPSPAESITVCATGPGTYDYTITTDFAANGSNSAPTLLGGGAFSLTNECKVVWTSGATSDPIGLGDDTETVTITQNQPAGTGLDAINVISGLNVVTNLGTRTAVFPQANYFHGGEVRFVNSEITIPGGAEGCTPGFWKNYKLDWPTYDPGDSYQTTFGIIGGYSGTLGEAIDAKGGGWNALARHSVAALLNAASGFYPMTVAEVIALVQDAADGTVSVESAKNQLAANNELGCPLDNSGE
jgi:hypothetical protein